MIDVSAGLFRSSDFVVLSQSHDGSQQSYALGDIAIEEPRPLLE